MTPTDDFPGEMDQFPFDDSDADAVFGAPSETVSVPEELGHVAELVRAARQSGSPDELVGGAVIVAQIAAAIGEHAASPQSDAHERIRVLSKFRTAKVAAAATAVMLLGGTAAAAATGTLPSPVQRSVADGLSGVGINIPAHHEIKRAAHHAETAGAISQHHADSRRGLGAFGTVASVNGGTDPTACGSSGVAGVFTLTGPKGKTFTVNVSLTTTFVDEAVTSPSFVNVCVGALVAAKGDVVDATVTATKIFVTPPRPPHVPSGARGIVASVNNMTDPTACGALGAGSFTLTARKGKTFTVTVDTSTTFTDEAISSPSFANVCVGSIVSAKGTVVDTTVTATSVMIKPAPVPDGPEDPKPEHHHFVFGTVASVGGLTTANACGTAGVTGTFTVTGRKGETFTVNVDTSTKFRAFGVTEASVANVCVGARVAAQGVLTDTTLAAAGVFVFPAHPDTPHNGFDPKKSHGHLRKHAGSDPKAKTFGSDHGAREHQHEGGSGASGGGVGGSGGTGEVERGHGSDH